MFSTKRVTLTSEQQSGFDSKDCLQLCCVLFSPSQFNIDLKLLPVLKDSHIKHGFKLLGKFKSSIKINRLLGIDEKQEELLDFGQMLYMLSNRQLMVLMN